MPWMPSIYLRRIHAELRSLSPASRLMYARGDSPDASNALSLVCTCSCTLDGLSQSR